MTGPRRGRDERPIHEYDPNSRRSIATALLTIGGAMAGTLLIIVFFLSGTFDRLMEPAPTPAPGTFTPIPGLTAPAVTPIPSGELPDEPAGDGTTATISTEVGDIVIELYNRSAPVAAQNFINLARADFYDGIVFHRVIADFVIQGGDPEETGSGGPGFTIPDDPVVGEYERGVVAMARPAGPGGGLVPDSQGSQFFIVLDDGVADRLPKEGGYSIFGNVIEGLDVVDTIAAGETGTGDFPLEPITILDVTIDDGT